MAAKVLIVEDEAVVAFEIRDILRGAGFEIAGCVGSIASCGSSVSMRRACRGRSLCPLRRPKNARGWRVGVSRTVLSATAELPVNTGPTGNARAPSTAPGRGNDPPSAQRPLERIGQIGSLPGETAVLFRRAAEMAVSGGAPIDRPAEL